MENIKLGIIGTNFVSDWLCDSVKVSERIVNHAIYSRKDETGQAFADKHDIPNVYTDMEDFLSSDIDAVYIASPNFLHYTQAEAAIRHGKHVLVEKPAALTRNEFESLEKMAKDAGVVILEAMRPAHDIAMDEVKNSLSKIGTIRRATFEFCQYSSRYDKFRAGEILNAFNPAMGNAAIMDIGIYPLHCCVMLFGKPGGIYSRSVKLHNGFDGMGTIFLDYGDIQAEVVYSKITDSVNPSIITGEDGTVSIGKTSTLETVTLHPRKGEPQTLIADREGNNMVYEIADFVKMIHGEMSPDKFNEITKITLGIIDEVREQNGIEFK
ncbi:MAG: Gfo/Idh/MocA family oxidoreductase [Ruminococcaceae bacterium]|nr:Gfo/Idh/MocA family oxidoreductase [Oscillospiraceae bacterium]